MAGTPFEFDATEAMRLARGLAGGTARLQDELLTAMQRSVALLQKDAMTATPVATGTLRRSITTSATPVLGEVGSAVAYARYVEEGRRAGAAMPPPGALLGWMAGKGIPAEAEFSVRRAIAARGIVGKRMFANALAKNSPAIEREFSEALRRFAAGLGG